jgi:hypothetical protein
VFIFVTGYSALTLEEAYQKGAAAMFPKPFNRRTLFNAVAWGLLQKEERWSASPRRLVTDIQLELGIKGLGTPVRSQMLNIGTGAKFVTFEGALPEVNAHVEFSIRINQGGLSQLSGTGIVRHRRGEASPGRPVGCGIEFVKFSEASLPEALRLIEALSPIAYIPSS